MSPLSIDQACAELGLNAIDIGDRGARPATRRRQELWCMLTPSARILLWGWTARQPDGWWSLVKAAASKANVRHLTYRGAIQPLIDVGWVFRSQLGAPGELWLTSDGRNARAALQRALHRKACRSQP